MLYANQSMKQFLLHNQDSLQNLELDKALKVFLDDCFITESECIFFSSQYIPTYQNKPFNKKDIVDQFTDLSGYEASTNRLHIEDYTNKDIYQQSFAFLKDFKKVWQDKFFDIPCVINISFQDDEVGKFATFTFHKKRAGENVFNVNNLEGYSQPIFIEFFHQKDNVILI